MSDDIATLLERTKNTNDTVDIISKDVKEMRDDLSRNITETALVKQSTTRLWWWVGGISLVLLGVAVKGAMALGAEPVEKLTCFIMSCVKPWFQ